MLGAYSSSFSLATSLLGAQVRADIRALYALVRVADEIVDGVGAEAGIDVAACLDAYEAAAVSVLRERFSPDPVVHAFGLTARACGFEEAWVRAFFASMRADIEPDSMGEAELCRYVYGSAEVIGLMCVAIFLRGRSVPLQERAVMDDSARRLGAAFQKVNFLRDLGDDSARLGRRYYEVPLTENRKTEIVEEIRGDFTAASPGLALLPRRARGTVAAARNIYADLLEEIARTPAAELERRRVRVSGYRKAWLAVRGAVPAGNKR